MPSEPWLGWLQLRAEFSLSVLCPHQHFCAQEGNLTWVLGRATPAVPGPSHPKPSVWWHMQVPVGGRPVGWPEGPGR